MIIMCSNFCVNIRSTSSLSRGAGVGAGTEADEEAGTDVGAEACVVADAESDVDVVAGFKVDAEIAGAETGTAGAEADIEAGAGADAEGVKKAERDRLFLYIIPRHTYPPKLGILSHH